MGDWNRQGKVVPPIYNPGKCEISSEVTDAAVQNIFAVAEDQSTEFQIYTDPLFAKE